VTDKKLVDVVESYDEDDFTRIEPEGVVVGENGKIWVQGRVVAGVVVAGESACVELQVKNHSSKRTTGLQISLTRTLHFPNPPPSDKPTLQLSDTLTTVAFRGPEYIVQPGSEGVASLVIDVPRDARSVKGGPRAGDEGERDGEQSVTTACLFEVRCTLGIKIGLPFGSKDILLDIPVTILHPLAIPQLPVTPERFTSPNPYGSPRHLSPPIATTTPPRRAPSPYMYPALPMSPPIQQYPDYTNQRQGQTRLPNNHHHRLPPPPPPPLTPNPYQYFSPPLPGQEYYFPPPPQLPYYFPPPHPPPSRSSSTKPHSSQALYAFKDQYHHSPLDSTPQHPGTPEEGKGERASRISHHLRMSSRHRSVSPQSHRFPLPTEPNASVSGTVMQNLPLPLPLASHAHGSLHLNVASLSPTRSGEGGVGVGEESVVHSPRPMLSPKRSFTIDPATHISLPKSERVEELERMAEEVEQQQKDLSDDLPKTAKTADDIDINKTLPSPPISSSNNKGNLLSPSPLGTSRPRVDAVFTTKPRQSSLASVDEAPPTPMLTAVTPVRLPRADVVNQQNYESGLDALERRLLAEVGTRKADKDDKKRIADVRNVLPIAIPSSAVEPLNDSAISSLTLADDHHQQQQQQYEGVDDRESDEGTHHAGKRSPSEDDEAGGGRRRQRKGGVHREGSSHGKEREDGQKRKKKERVKDGEAHRRRKSAKGRVAAWLGGIDPEVPPVDISSSMAVADLVNDTSGAPDLHHQNSQESLVMADVAPEMDTSSAPNPRSSGFVPIGTLKRDEGQRQSGIKERGYPYKVAKDDGLPPASPFTRSRPPSPKANPTSLSPDAPNPSPKNQPQPPIPLPKRAGITSYKASLPTPDPEVKYDVRSARGGRGGRVTAVASIWASQTGDQVNVKQAPAVQKPLRNGTPVKPVTKPPAKTPPKVSHPDHASVPPDPSSADLTARRARLAKSQSVPAAISSSHATPILSSTASLARPTPLPDRRKTPVKLPPTISDSQPEMSQPASRANKPQSVAGDLAFGQARLRDLIRKYQGQATS